MKSTASSLLELAPKMIEGMGDKANAKATMLAAGVPCVPGSEGLLKDGKHAVEMAKEVGLPVMMKATAGGGGKGMRVVWKEEDVADSLAAIQREAAAAFGNDGVYMEKFIEEPRTH